MITATLLLLAQPGAAEAQDLYSRVAALPPAVRTVIERRAMCNHWGGEEPHDKARRRQIRQAMNVLRCATVHGEAVFMRRHFAASSEVIMLLDSTAEESGWPADAQQDR